MSFKVEYHNNVIESIGKTSDLEIVPDDRQEIVQIIGGVTVEDYGVIADGEVTSFSATFSSSDYNTLVDYWRLRTKVKVTFDDGRIINDARIVIRRTQYYDDLLNGYKKVTLEVWRV